MDNYVPLEVYENLKEKFLEKEGEIDDRNTQIRNLEEQINNMCEDENAMQAEIERQIKLAEDGEKEYKTELLNRETLHEEALCLKDKALEEAVCEEKCCTEKAQKEIIEIKENRD